jgi:hypothetical protein
MLESVPVVRQPRVCRRPHHASTLTYRGNPKRSRVEGLEAIVETICTERIAQLE